MMNDTTSILANDLPENSVIQFFWITAAAEQLGDLMIFLTKRAQGRGISGLSAYEQ